MKWCLPPASGSFLVSLMRSLPSKWSTVPTCSPSEPMTSMCSRISLASTIARLLCFGRERTSAAKGSASALLWRKRWHLRPNTALALAPGEIGEAEREHAVDRDLHPAHGVDDAGPGGVQQDQGVEAVGDAGRYQHRLQRLGAFAVARAPVDDGEA